MANPSQSDVPMVAPRRRESTVDRLPTFMTVDELAFLLRVNRNSVYEALARGEIPGAR